MDILQQHSSLIGVALVVILLLVKELIGYKQAIVKMVNPENLVTKDLCVVRHENLQKDIQEIKVDVKDLKNIVNDLPRHINGGTKR